MKPVLIGAAVVLAICATEISAFACSCTRVVSFEEELREAPIVVVGTLTSTRHAPQALRDERSDAVNVPPPYTGSGITMAVTSVIKGDVSAGNIRIWSLGYGECGGAISALKGGESIVIAINPVAATPLAVRRGLGAASTIPETDYFAGSGCRNPLTVIAPENLNQWTGRRLN